MQKEILIKIIDIPVVCDAYRSSTMYVDHLNRIFAVFNYYDVVGQVEFLCQQYRKHFPDGDLFGQEEYLSILDK